MKDELALDINKVFEDFGPLNKGNNKDELNHAITIWLTDDYKSKYDELQFKTGRKFGKILRALINKTIDHGMTKI